MIPFIFLKPKDSKRTIFDFHETNAITILATTDNGFFEITNDDYPFREIMPETNFSSISQSLRDNIFLWSYGKGLFIKDVSDSDLKQFKGFEAAEFFTNLDIRDFLIYSWNQLWIATYGQGTFLINFIKETIQNFTENKKTKVVFDNSYLYFFLKQNNKSSTNDLNRNYYFFNYSR